MEWGSTNSISSTSISGQTITFNIQSPVSVSAGTKIRIEVGDIKNTGTAASNYQVTVTTKRSDGTTVDGPTTSSAFSIRKVGSATISDNSISTSMIKEHAVTGSKVAGISKLVFIQCIVSSSISLSPGSGQAIGCNNSSVAEGDAVVATMDSLNCLDLRGALVQFNGLIRFDFENECPTAAALGTVTIWTIVFKPT